MRWAHVSSAYWSTLDIRVDRTGTPGHADGCTGLSAAKITLTSMRPTQSWGRGTSSLWLRLTSIILRLCTTETRRPAGPLDSRHPHLGDDPRGRHGRGPAGSPAE